MPIVTPNWDLPTPALTDPYNLVGDLATFASAVDDALTETGNVFKGTATQRIAFASTAVNGMLWQDTDGIKMIWRRDSTVSGNWTPAVWRWAGTTAQMNAFTQAPDGFEWFNTSNNLDYLREGGSWRGGWVSCTLGTGMSGSVSARRVGGITHLRGTVARTAGNFPTATAGESAFYLPVSPDIFRPVETTRLYAGSYGSGSGNGLTAVFQSSSRTVTVFGWGASLDTAYITGISFPNS